MVTVSEICNSNLTSVPLAIHPGTHFFFCVLKYALIYTRIHACNFMARYTFIFLYTKVHVPSPPPQVRRINIIRQSKPREYEIGFRYAFELCSILGINAIFFSQVWLICSNLVIKWPKYLSYTEFYLDRLLIIWNFLFSGLLIFRV